MLQWRTCKTEITEEFRELFRISILTGRIIPIRGSSINTRMTIKNHYVSQQYLPDDIKSKKYYVFGDNKIEQAAKAYWDLVKGKT